MSDKKISDLPASTTPLAGTEVLPIVQGGQTRQVSVNNLTTGKSVSATQFVSTVATGTAPLTVSSTTEVANLRAANATSADTANQVKSNATTGVLQVVGPATGTTRVMTTPNANFTVARTDAANSFSGNQTFDSGTLFVDSTNDIVSVGSNTPADVTVKLIVTGTAGVTAVSGILFNDTASRQYIIYNDGTLHLYDATAAADRLAISSAGNVTVSTGNLIVGTAAKGIDFSANTHAAGMTSELLNWYEEGTWTPSQGAGLVVVGSFGSSGTYTRIGRQVTLVGTITGSTSVACASGNVFVGGFPFNVGTYGSGTAFNNAITESTVLGSDGGSNIYSTTAINATTRISFVITYFV